MLLGNGNLKTVKGLKVLSLERKRQMELLISIRLFLVQQVWLIVIEISTFVCKTTILGSANL